MRSTENYGRALLHNHTTYSDGLTTIEQFFTSCQTLNIDVALISDHDTFKGALKAQEYAVRNNIRRPQIIAGIEVSYSLAPFSHVVFAFPPNAEIFDIPPYRGFDRTVDYFKSKCPDGIIIFPHPILQTLHLGRVDGVETNCKRNPKNLNIGNAARVSGADTHFPYPYDKSWNYITIFPGTTAQDLILSIRNSTTIPITDNNILYPPTFPMKIEQYQKALIERFPAVAKDITQSFLHG